MGGGQKAVKNSGAWVVSGDWYYECTADQVGCCGILDSCHFVIISVK